MSILKDICLSCGEDTFSEDKCECGESKFIFSYDEFTLNECILSCQCGNKEFKVFEIISLNKDRHIVDYKCDSCQQHIYIETPKNFDFFKR